MSRSYILRKFSIILLLILCNSVLFATNNALQAVKIMPLPDDRVRIDFQFKDKIINMPASFITEKPARLVLDFIDSDNDLTQKQTFKKVALGSLDSYKIIATNNRVRVMLNLFASVAYSGSVSGNTYSVTFSGKSHHLFEPKREVFVTNRAVNARYEINSLDYRGTGNLSGRAVIGVSNSSIPIDVTQVGKEVIVNLNNTQIPAQLLKRFDVADFQSPAQFLTLRQEGKTARLTINNNGDYGYFAYQVNKQFIVEVFPLTAEEVKQAKLKKKVYTGKLISLNFQNIPVRSVLQLLAEFTGINMVVSDQVKDNITLRLNNTPWDQALDIILRTNKLDKRKTGNVILIAPADDLLKQEKADLKSQIEVKNLAPLRSDLIQINYAKATDIATLIKDKNTSLLSKRGSISVDVRTNSIWIQDIGAQIEETRELIKRLDIPVKQVLIESRIVNVRKNFTEDLGIRFGVSKPTSLSGTLDGANQMSQPGATPASVVPYTQRLNIDLAASPTSLVAPGSIGIALAKLGNNVLLDLELSALESEGKGEVIASPRLITTNQQPAVIESGEEIPYNESTSSGAAAIAFKKAVLSLKVTPQITPDNKIMMDLQINQDEPLFRPGIQVPSILTKQITTTVLVDNGQTIVLGGIYKQDTSNAINRVPFLGELPVVGALFRNKNVTTSNEELLIFITPRIITNTLSITTVEGQQKVVINNIRKHAQFGKPERPWKQ